MLNVFESGTRYESDVAGRMSPRSSRDRIDGFVARRASANRRAVAKVAPAPRPSGEPGERSTIAVGHDSDVSLALASARAVAKRIGFSGGDQIVIEAVVAELARNILRFAGKGEVAIDTQSDAGRPGIVLVARDDGPGIPDLTRALADGFSTTGHLGLGLAGVRRLMDSFDVVSAPGKGTTITTMKWRDRAG